MIHNSYKFLGLILFFAFFSSSVLGQDVPIQWDYANSNTQLYPHPNNVIKRISSASTDWNAWGRSKNKFDCNEPAILKYNGGTPIANHEVIVGFDTYLNNYGYSDVNYGFKVSETQVRVVYRDPITQIGGLYYNHVRTAVGNEDLELRRRETSLGSGVWEMDFVIDGDVVFTGTCTNEAYYAYGLLRKVNSKVLGLKAQVVTNANITNSGVCGTGILGAVDITVSGGIPPYDIDWGDNIYTEDITGLNAGRRNVSITDAGYDISYINLHPPAIYSFDILRGINWSSALNVTSNAEEVVANTTLGSAFSQDYLPPNQSGLLRFKVIGTSGQKNIGFSQTNGVTPEHGFIFLSGTVFTVVDPSGTIIYTGNYLAGDVFEIQRAYDGQFTYYQNEVAITGVNTAGLSAASYYIDLSSAVINEGFSLAALGICGDFPVSVTAPQIPIQWSTGNNVIIDPLDNTSFMSTSNNNTSWAKSINTFDANEEAILRYRAPAISTSSERTIGIGPDLNSYGFTNVNFGFRIRENDIKCIYHDPVTQAGGGYTTVPRMPGKREELALIRHQLVDGSWEMKYQVNGETVFTRVCTADEYRAYMLVLNPNRTINNVTAEPIVKSEMLQHESCGISSNGTIDITISGGIPPYAISWSGGATTEDLTNLTTGTHTVNVSDAGGNVFERAYEVHNSVLWGNASADLTIVPESIVKNTGTTNTASGAFSQNKLVSGQAGFTRFQPLNTNGIVAIGFSQTDANLTHTSIEHGMIFNNGCYEIYDANGAVSCGSAYEQGAVFEIRKAVTGQFSYYVNGVALPYTTQGNSSADYFIDMSCYEPEDGFSFVITNFCGLNPPVLNVLNYAKLKDKLDGGFIKSQNGKILFTYRGEYNDQPSEYKVVNNAGVDVYNQANLIIVNDLTGDHVNMEEGYGYYSIDVDPTVNASFITGEFYTLEVTNPKGEKAYLRFKII